MFTIRSQPQNRVTDHALAAVWLAWAGQSEEARQHLQAATQAAHAISTPMTPVFLNAARLAVALADDEEAVAGLAAEVHRLCVDQPSLARLVDRLFLAVQYRLLPETRAWWDSQPLQGCYAAGRELARVLVALDEGGNPDLARGAAPGLIRAFLPARWVTDLTAAGGRFAAMVAAAAPAALSDATAPSVHVQLLGPARLLRDETPVTSPLLRRGRVRELLAYLLLHHGARRERVAADLWPDLDEAAAALNLRVTLSYLGRLLEPDRPRIESSRLLNRTGGQINLVDSPLLTVDVWTFDQLLDQAGHAEQQHAPSVALARYKLAITTYTGPLLADQPVPGLAAAAPRPAASPVRHRRRPRRRTAARQTEPRPNRYTWRGAPSPPTEGSEPAHQLLVSAYLAAGNDIAARHALDDCHRMLRSLGASPDARTRMLTRQLTSTVSTQRLTTG